MVELQEPIKKTKGIISKTLKTGEKLLAPGRPINSPMARTPQTILSKEQKMLGALFNSKNQFWGNGEPVQINNTLTSGNGLIKTGSGNATRRLMF